MATETFPIETGGLLPTNVKPYTGPESLPSGSILRRSYRGSRYPMDMFVEEVAKELGISERDRAINYYTNGLTGPKKYWPRGSRFGSLVDGLARKNEKAFAIANKMAELEPHLAWMRGGSLRVQNGVAILEHSGADGLVGGSVEQFSRKDYSGAPRERPVIFRIRWKNIIDALASNLFYPGTHHAYDFSLLGSVDNDKAVAWQKKHLTAYLLPQLPQVK